MNLLFGFKNQALSLGRRASIRKDKSSVFKMQKNNGFTLVELLVTITMFVIITGVILVNSNQFDNTILLNNFAYDLALTIKQAQTYGVNVKESVSGTFGSYYGVYFDKTPVSGSNLSFALFDFTPSDPLHPDFSVIKTVDITKTCSTYPECIQKYKMNKGTYINNICAINTGTECSFYNKLIIAFKRPSLAPLMFASNGETDFVPVSYAKIVLSSANGATSSVVVTSTGQIYVKK